jgi:ABC-type nitrate/sulfonate/bicarbonate transport system permease component
LKWGTRLLGVGWPALVLLALWQTWIIAAHVSPVIAPSPAAVAVELVSHPMRYAQATAATAAVAAAGLARLLGYGEPTVVASAAAITFLPTFVLVGAGLRQTPPGAAELFGVFGASRWQRLKLLALPSAVPNVLTALRIAAADSVLAALVAEYLMGQTGLGNMLADAQSQLLTAQAWSASLIATVLSVAAFATARAVERANRYDD